MASRMRQRRLITTVAAILATSGLAWAQAPRAQPPREALADRVVVEKAARTLTLLRKGTPIASYSVALGPDPIGHKQREGDGRTPEGIYVLDWRSKTGRFHWALHVSYPNAADILAAKRAGVAPGGDIFIHGMTDTLGWIGPLHRIIDWTAGCIAVTNAEIEDIWRLVPNGTVIEIRP
ncbi:MAG: L,D-transpeptidase family protein [Acidobacteriota bacterium]